jgi:hypothetical protein
MKVNLPPHSQSKDVQEGLETQDLYHSCRTLQVRPVRPYGWVKFQCAPIPL